MFIVYRKGKAREAYDSFGWDHKVGDVRITPQICESVRVDGKPRRRVVASLPSMPQRWLDDPTSNTKIWFWEGVNARLERLGNRIPGDEAAKLRATLAAKLPEPTRADYEDQYRRHKASEEATARVWGDRPPRAQPTQEQLDATARAWNSYRAGAMCGECGALFQDDETIHTVWFYKPVRNFLSSSRFLMAVCRSCGEARDEWPTYDSRECDNPRCNRLFRTVQRRQFYCSQQCSKEDAPRRKRHREEWRERHGYEPRPRQTWARRQFEREQAKQQDG